MAVITPLSREQIETFLLDYAHLGQLTEFKPTLQGIENTSYFLTLQRPNQTPSHCVLTLFEELTDQQLPFYNQLLQQLANESLPVPAPIPNQHGEVQASIQNKPAVLFPRLQGRHPEQVSEKQCSEIGLFLGRMHRITADPQSSQANSRDLQWMHTSLEYLAPHLNSADQQLLESELRAYQSVQPEFDKLPMGIIHADLFRDNALLEGDKLTGVIDFYSACSGPLLYDLAVVANDWCRSQDKLDSALTATLLQAYQLERHLEPQELNAWPIMLRFAASRFWISRLLGCHPAIADKPSKDPAEFRQILIQRLESFDP